MARVSYIPHDQDAEDRKAEWKADRKAMRNEHVEMRDQGPARFNGKDPEDPEYETVVDFVEYQDDNDETEYDFGDLNCLNARMGIRIQDLKAELAEWGLTLKHRAFEHEIRGFTSNNHDRWYGKGASPTHGGGGGDSIVGMAGQAG